MYYDEPYLAHYGVKGMKWGVRKARKIVGHYARPKTIGRYARYGAQKAKYGARTAGRYTRFGAQKAAYGTRDAARAARNKGKNAVNKVILKTQQRRAGVGVEKTKNFLATPAQLGAQAKRRRNAKIAGAAAAGITGAGAGGAAAGYAIDKKRKKR